MATTGILFFVSSSVLLFELVRRRRIKERMALYWALIPLLVLLFAINPLVVASLAHWLGFTLVSNFLLVSLTLLLLLLTLYLSATIGRMEDEIHVLAEEIAILKGKRL
jgi:hypothetical protein